MSQFHCQSMMNADGPKLAALGLFELILKPVYNLLEYAASPRELDLDVGIHFVSIEY